MGIVRKIRNPELFQGGLNRRRYFEGWYFKLISRDMRWAAAAIPGVALGAGRDSPDSHAFVQFILGGRSEYYKYPLAAFRADPKAFRVTVGGSEFRREGAALRLENEHGSVAGELCFTDALPFPKTGLWPGIMGPYGYVPFMECYHGIVSIRHRIEGRVLAFGEELDFSGGSGYIEKDWGHAFPSAWVWVQANHFAGGEAFLFSVAEIPWLGRGFTGFFAFLYRDGTLTRFATYTGARILRLEDRGGEIGCALGGRDGTLEFHAKPGPCGMLKAPKNGLMNVMIEESLASTVRVALYDRYCNLVFEGTSGCAGMERYGAVRLPPT